MRPPRISTPRPRFPRRPAALGLLFATALWLLAPGVASAHAHLVQADPAPGGVIAHAPSVASFLFDEPLNPALTHVRVTSTAGRVVAQGGRLASGHGGELWRLPLPSLQAGVYSVFWTSESAVDGHVMSSFYTFRVAATGTTAAAGAVMGTAAGATGGMSTGADTLLAIGTGASAIALFSWLGQMAQALWLGALVIELAVLASARRGDLPEARLAWAATRRVWRLGVGALVGSAASLVAQMVCLAVQGTGGDWSRALAPDTLAGMFSSQNGQVVVARLAILLAALAIAMRVPVPDALMPDPSPGAWRAQRASQALGIVARPFAVPQWESIRIPIVLLAGIYMALAALSGHAADVTPLWLSCGIDWIHLVGTGAWIGGIAALAYGVMPLRHALPPKDRAAAVLPLLDRFSPVAYVAVGALALSGLFNAVSHLHSPAMVTGTIYGHLLGLKSGLVGVLIALSATHVRGLRPFIARAQRSMRWRPRSLASVHEGLATLAGRLRLEAGIGAGVLLVTALMGQTLPPTGVPAARVSTTTAAPASITGAAALGDLRANLTVAPPAVGAVTLTLRLWERGTAIGVDDGAAIIHLYPAAQPAMRAALTTEAHGTRFSVRGSLAMSGVWHADVLVRTALVNSYRTLSFAFTAGRGARFLSPSHHAASGMDRMAGM